MVVGMLVVVMVVLHLVILALMEVAAVLEQVQERAIPSANATIVDRFFGTASSAPASVFGRLLRGAKKILAEMRPVVIFEVNPEACARFGLSPNGVRELLEDLGYEFRVLHHDGTFFRPRLPSPYFNVVAIPTDR